MALLLVPLAKSASETTPGELNRASVINLLAELDADDCRLVYEAIKLAAPGGLGKVPDQDVEELAPTDLIAAMKLAADRDLIARQYANGFEQVFIDVVAFLLEGFSRFDDLNQAIVFAHVRLMSTFPDSLIARKNGLEIARHSQFLASKCIDAVDQGQPQFWSQVGDLDFWLRSDGHRRNPGTTADMIAAGLFVAIFNEQITLRADKE